MTINYEVLITELIPDPLVAILDHAPVPNGCNAACFSSVPEQQLHQVHRARQEVRQRNGVVHLLKFQNKNTSDILKINTHETDKEPNYLTT